MSPTEPRHTPDCPHPFDQMMTDLIVLVGHVFISEHGGMLDKTIAASCRVGDSHLSAEGRTAGEAIIELSRMVERIM